MEVLSPRDQKDPKRVGKSYTTASHLVIITRQLRGRGEKEKASEIRKGGLGSERCASQNELFHPDLVTEQLVQKLYFFRFVCDDFDQVKVLSCTENIYTGSSISIDGRQRHCFMQRGLSPALFDNNAYFASDPVFFKTLSAIPVQGL